MIDISNIVLKPGSFVKVKYGFADPFWAVIQKPPMFSEKEKKTKILLYDPQTQDTFSVDIKNILTVEN